MKIEGVIYPIKSAWKADAEGPATIGARLLELLDRLRPLDPAMANWLWADGVVPVPLAKVRPDITRYVERNVATHNGEPDPRGGYNLFARGGPIETEPGSSRSVDVHLQAGSQWDNHVRFEIGGLLNFPDPDLTTYPIYKGALEAMASTFPCPYAWARYFISTETIWIPNPDGGGGATAAREDPLGPFDGVWIGYLSAPLAAGFTPPADLFPERTPGGGLILSAVKDHIDPTNPDHVRRSQRLQAIMTKQAARPDHRGSIEPGDFQPRVGLY
jgi:hypothetical protein